MEDDGFSCLFDAVITRPPRLDCNASKIYIVRMLRLRGVSV